MLLGWFLATKLAKLTQNIMSFILLIPPAPLFAHPARYAAAAVVYLFRPPVPAPARTAGPRQPRQALRLFMPTE